ncbi:MAG: ATP-dependent zinc metalloprotease FtsH [Candidatus Omnitrophica bacterium]|nr:ATP-dependent zinc metalloprotease FtsH [Candidatus Omnitrophota bacterium]
MNGQKKRNNKSKNNQKNSPGNRNLTVWLLILFGLTYLFQLGEGAFTSVPTEIVYSDFYSKVVDGQIASATLSEDRVIGKLMDGTRYTTVISLQDPGIISVMRTNIADFNIKQPQTFLSNIFWAIIGPVVLVSLFWFLMYRGSSAGGGGKILSFGKSGARLAKEGALKITFADVAGVDEAKEELKEVIEFLKEPKKFQRLGGKMPKGVLVMGPPGCGKTLLAKAVAGEAGVPFFSISGSDFVEMFVGVGASRVRDLFEQAKKSVRVTQKGCIIFLDEIDAVGRQRFAGIGGGHDEREQTLNALLVEMDGFDTQAGIVLIAATNRPDVLDPALLRPGRFDRQIVVDRPDINGRIDILKVHASRVKLGENVDLDRIAQQTPGFSGADLANLVNEAALLGARRNEDSVSMGELEESIERVMAGPQRRSRVISPEEKKIISYHESGHALLSLLIDNADPMHKVTIISRGMALGYTFNPPKKDRYLKDKEQLLAEMKVALGGRVAEEMIFGKVTTGATNDISVVSSIAREMVTQYGMNETLGQIAYGKKHGPVFLGRDLAEERNYSESTAKVIDDEVKKLVDFCYDCAKEVLILNKEKLELLANALLEKESMNDVDVRTLLGMDKPVVGE